MGLEARGLVKTFRHRKVVNDVNVRIDRGEVVGLLGPNGAGKTTTFYMVVGLLTPAVVHDAAAAGHDPTPTQRALVELRDLGCVGVGCGMGPGRVELDHITRYPDGPTAVWNLDSKSPRCHHAKHHGWGVEADALADHARHGRWDEMAGVVSDAMVDAFAVVAEPAGLRAALDRRADGLVDRVAPYPPFGTGPWNALVS